MIQDYFGLAFKNLRQRKIRSWLTMVGIFIGIAAVVSLISLGQGLKGAILSQFAEAGSDKLTVQAAGIQYGPPGSGAVTPLTEKDAQAVRSVLGVKLVAERHIRSFLMEYRSEPLYTYGADIPTDSSREMVLSAANVEISSGRMLTPTDRNKIIVGGDFATKKVFSKTLVLGDKVQLNGQDFEIVGFLKSVNAPGGGQIVLMNDKAMKDLLGYGDDIDMFSVQVQPNSNVTQVSANVERALRRSRNVKLGQEDFTVQTPLQAAEALSSILNYATWFLVGIAFISIVVGAVGITNTMYTAVLERRREIGIMKSIGARNSHVFTLFFIESGILGMLGGAIGIVLGVVLSEVMVLALSSFLGSGLISAEFSFLLIFGALAFSFIVGSVAGTLPAYQASKLHPVDALRK